MPVIFLDHKNQKLSICPQRIVDLLERRPRSDEAIAELDRLHRERRRLLCECERILHVVQWEFPFLRRNPGQNSGGVECGLCEASRQYESQSTGVSAARRERSGVSFILATRTHPEGCNGEKGETDRGLTRNAGGGLKYARAFGVFFSMMEGAGFTSLASSLPWNEAWGRLHDQLTGIHLHPESRKTLADFCWMPGGFYRGGLKGMNDRLLAEWDHPEIQPEGWLFAIVEEPPESDSVSISAITSAMRRKNEVQGKEVYPPYVLTVPKHNVAIIGRTGPYLALAAASVNDKESTPYRKPIFRRLLLQSIAGEHNPVPVESSYERETVFLLQRLKVPFRKPVFDDAEGLRPDFVLPNHRLIIEVQGFNTDDYREKKKLIHQRLLDCPGYDRFELITYDPNDGQSLKDFENNLRSSITHSKSEKRALRVKNP